MIFYFSSRRRHTILQGYWSPDVCFPISYFAPTYGNTLMGLGPHKPPTKEDNWAIIYYPPAPRAMIEVVDPDDPGKRSEEGRVGKGTGVRGPEGGRDEV